MLWPGRLTRRQHSSDKTTQDFPEKAQAHLKCFLLLSTILSHGDCEAWQALCGLLVLCCLGSCSRTPSSPLIRRKCLCLRKQGRLSTLHPRLYSRHNPVLELADRRKYICPWSHGVFPIIVLVWSRIIMAYTLCLCLNWLQLSRRFGMQG